MDINTADAPRYVAAGRIDINAPHKSPELDPHKAEDPDKTTEKSLIDEIREKGFGAYLKDMEEEKKKLLREKILGEMGLSEEALEKMSPEARAQIEKMVSAEMIKRMIADGELNRQQNGLLEQPGIQSARAAPLAGTKIDAAGVGIGPLLALQEADRQNEEINAKRDDDAG